MNIVIGLGICSRGHDPEMPLAPAIKVYRWVDAEAAGRGIRFSVLGVGLYLFWGC